MSDGARAMRLFGVDPGLRITGWGVLDVADQHLSFVACGTVTTDGEQALAARLVQLHEGLAAAIAHFGPDSAAVEETFVNRNPASTLKLGQARGVALLVPALAGLEVAEYAANLIKKSVVGHRPRFEGPSRHDGAHAAAGVRGQKPRCAGRSRGRDLPCPSPRQREPAGGRAGERGGPAMIAKLAGVLDFPG